MSSGLSVIPGGAQVASIATNALTAGLSKIPGTDGIADMIKKAQTAAMNGLPSPAALLDAAKDGLAKLASIGLPAGAAAQLTAFMQGLGSSARVKLPAIAITSGNARDAVDGTVSTVLVDKRIPAPQFKVTSSPPTSLEVLGESSRLGRAYMDAITASGKAMNKYTKTLQNFPQGSPEVEAAWAAIQAAKAAKDAAALALQDYNAAHGVMT